VNANLPIAQAATAEAGMAKTGVVKAAAVKAAAVKAAVAALLLASTLYLSAGPHQADNSSASVAHSMATRQKVIGISNFSKVSPSLYRGGQPSSAGIESLQKMGIGIVVDMREGRNQSEKAAVQKAGMQCVSIPWHCPFPSDKTFARFLKLIQENPQEKIFVHRRLGDDRTGMAMAAYRMAIEGWSADEAMNEMRALGFTGVHHEICPGLARYEKSFPHRLQTGASFKDLRAHGSPALSK
jgi:protein tyrosine phosphatase (PTP) superfamily phosphohydrolase (DUF442 family)